MIRELPTPVRPHTPPPAPPPSLAHNKNEVATARRQPRSGIPSLGDLLEEEEHEVSIRRRRACRKRTTVSASKIHHSRRLAAKEHPFYVDATTKASRVKAV